MYALSHSLLPTPYPGAGYVWERLAKNLSHLWKTSSIKVIPPLTNYFHLFTLESKLKKYLWNTTRTPLKCTTTHRPAKKELSSRLLSFQCKEMKQQHVPSHEKKAPSSTDLRPYYRIPSIMVTDTATLVQSITKLFT